MTEARCELCGEPLPPGEEMFKYHGYSCECPKPPLPKPPKDEVRIPRAQYEALRAALQMYGKHPKECAVFDRFKKACDCGLDAALRSAGIE